MIQLAGTESFSPPTSSQRRATPQTDAEGGRLRELYHRGGWTDEIWGRQWGWQTNSHGHRGQPVGRKHCLAVDNKLLPRRVIAARPEAAVPAETSILCHSEARASSRRPTRDSARCVLLIWEFMTLTFSWFLNALPRGPTSQRPYSEASVGVHASMNYPAPTCTSPSQGYTPCQISVRTCYL